MPVSFSYLLYSIIPDPLHRKSLNKLLKAASLLHYDQVLQIAKDKLPLLVIIITYKNTK